MCNQEQAIAILGEVYDGSQTIFGNKVKDAYLYGSYARGDFRPESDVDILLTIDMARESISKLLSAVGILSSDLSLKYDVTVAVTAVPHAQFEQYAQVLPFYKNVLQEGIRRQA